jgi:hypothetical protein
VRGRPSIFHRICRQKNGCLLVLLDALSGPFTDPLLIGFFGHVGVAPFLDRDNQDTPLMARQAIHLRLAVGAMVIQHGKFPLGI